MDDEAIRMAEAAALVGFLLGTLIERYAVISVKAYGYGWMMRPLIIAIILITILTLSTAPGRKEKHVNTLRRGDDEIPGPMVVYDDYLSFLNLCGAIGAGLAAGDEIVPLDCRYPGYAPIGDSVGP